MNIKWPTIFSSKPDIRDQFIDVCTEQYLKSHLKVGVDRELPTTTTLYQNANYAIWNGGPCVVQSAWNNQHQVMGHGWVDPYEVKSDEWKNFFGLRVNIPWESYKTGEVKQKSKITELNGNFAGFHTWWHNNYGHIIHDNLPYLTWFLSVIPVDYKVLMLDSDIKKDMLRVLDKQLYDRVIWINVGDTIKITGNLIVSTPDCHPCIMGGNFMKHFKSWMYSNDIGRKPRDIIFYTRRGTTIRRVLDEDNERKALDVVKNMMVKHNIDGDLKIFSGKNDEQKLLSIQEQIEIFKNAHTIIGPHGTGMINMVYSDLDAVKILEFVPSVESGRVQRPFNGYHNTVHGLEMDYNHILYVDDSTEYETKIDLNDLENALNTMWG